MEKKVRPSLVMKRPSWLAVDIGPVAGAVGIAGSQMSFRSRACRSTSPDGRHCRRR